MIEFSHPWILIFLALIPILWIWMLKAGQKLEGTVLVSSHRIFPESIKKKGILKSRLLKILRLSVLSLIIVGLAGPRRIDTLQETNVDVVDIVLVIDISSSMLATDFEPNRLEAVKKTADMFIQEREGDRMGLLVFAGETFIQCPLTVDQDVVRRLLADVRVAEQAYDGTAIGMAIANATNRLRNSKAKSKVMILLSDGSNNAGELDPLTAADLASQFGIKIYTIGAGTDRSVSFVPGRGNMRNVIDEKTLKSIADKTGGRYFRAKDRFGLEEVYAEINALERTEIKVKEYTRYEELFAWFLLPALVAGLGTESFERHVLRKRT
ncbi:MAG: VWA domain-containing protein [Candidatus Marinimicrobia bacterium]|jgi:Ca-activated chloride channel family protein|nr:VWA domain-containing protein [Candidatus Neomarinimicrobiota bacterium]MBT3617858.1 VWA domain-containing protein [Candidatus Neomarinimicrobiota bacterium]MBT3828215.1 VWA domain-containing protein [Candidatus Neomarinimicrobiota bacterium]MBT3997132.1 VWA domain-containing protein [Candidatus Neomarinimicrobiota bacterium]MBT4280598.1 VWA domain-containing protein [Candidatus Neomarinimicrobiota bacterium]